MARKVIYYPRFAFKPLTMKVNSGASGDFTIPTYGSNYNYSVATSDGQTFHGVTGVLTITFPSIETDYILKIYGDFPRISFISTPQSNRNKIIEVSIGDVIFDSLRNAFNSCMNLEIADLYNLNTSSIDDMYRAFPSNYVLTSIGYTSWDFSLVTSLNYFLHDCRLLTEDIDFNCALNTDLRNFAYRTRMAKIHLDCDSVAFINEAAFQNVIVDDLILNNMPVSFWINKSPSLLGSAIDALANSVRDLTGGTSRTVTMTVAQYNSGIDISLWSGKNWTINQV